ncbi:distal tail protein Dit [Cohnella sp.]|uniref:distal tail protein Dit n=1 Tax=Cohnella sp. TaxID=1883426 RepID=UPI003564AD3F
MVVASIGGVRPSEIGLQVLRESERPVLPDTRDRMLTIPGRNGAWDFGSDLEPKRFNLDCAFMTPGARTLQQCVETLARLLLDPYGRPRTVELIFSVTPDRSYQVRYSGSMPISRLVGMGRFTLPLIAVDPFSYQIEPILDSDVLLDSDVRLDGEIYGFPGVTSGSTVNVPNKGDFIVRPYITVEGSFGNLAITSGGKTFYYTAPISNKTLIIDGESLTVEVDGVNMLHMVAGDFIELAPGDNAVTVSGAGLACDIEFDVSPRYL